MKAILLRKLIGFLAKGEREVILTELVKKHFNTISKEDIFKIEGKVWTFEGRELEDSEREMIIAQAKQIQNMFTWKILEKEVMWRANREMYLKSTDVFGITMGKSWQYVFDIINSKLKDIVG